MRHLKKLGFSLDFSPLPILRLVRACQKWRLIPAMNVA